MGGGDPIPTNLFIPSIFTSKSMVYFKWYRCLEYVPSVLNIVLIQILSQTISTNVFMLLLCLQGALLPSVWPIMKLICGIELVLRKWFLIYIKLDLKENQDTLRNADSCGRYFAERVLHLSVPFLLQFWEEEWGWMRGSQDHLCFVLFPSSLPAFVNHSRKVIQKLAVR